MSSAATQFQETVDALGLTALQRRVVSTITGAELSPTADLRRLLVEQLTAPVRFTEAFNQVSQSCDLLIEVGPGQVLTHLVNGDVPAIALDIAGPSLADVLSAAAAAYVMGAPLRLETLFNNRFTRPFNLDRPLRFFVNPCELAPASTTISHGPRAIQAGQNGNGGAKIATEEPSPATASVGSAVQVIRALVARRTELPPAAVQESARLLGDLHLNSIVVAEMVAAAARELGMSPPARPLDFADATVGELAQALERLRKTSPGLVPEREAAPAGVDEWVRAFFVEWAPSSLPPRSGPPSSPGRWTVFASASHPLAEHLSKTVFPDRGVIVCLSSDRMEQQAGVLLQAAHAALTSGEGKRYFVVAGPAASVSSAFARTLHLENPDILTRVIEAASDSVLGDYIFQEVACASGHIEARYDGAGQRWAPGFKILPGGSEDHIPLQPDDVLLVSGGGKGIVAECASALARETGARLVVLGRSRPEDSAELTQQLARLAAGGVTVKYIPTDITDAQAVRSAVHEAESVFGRVGAVVHGAGLNEPALLRDLDEPALQRTLAPKVGGLQNLLAAVDAAQLRLLVTFGSVIGRVGLRGEAHYALANACLASLTEEFARRHPACHCLAFESSAWSGLGMAERLGTVEALHRDGIATIPPKEGVAWFRDLLARRLPETAVVVTGRLAAASPLPIHAPPMPLMRFLERPRVHYPGVELVVESDVTTASDPYLLDHVFHGQPLLPGVMGLEAMAQAAMAVACEERIPVLEQVRFEQPVVVEPRTRVTLRIAALVRETGLVEVVLRSSQTSFAMDHFRCVCRFTDSLVPGGDIPPLPEFPRLAVEPARDLYGVLLFQTGRFRRLAGYRWLTARSSWAEIAPADRQARSSQNWFSQYLPGALMLGDPAARDAAVHSVQACVPHAVLLPVGVERLTAGRLNAEEKLLAHARERWQQGNTYCYDVELRSADGTMRELWEGLTLRKVADASAHAWPDPLVAASLEWRMREMTTSTELAAAFERDPATDRRSRSERAIQRALGSRQAVHWRSDGKPEVESAMSVSSAHMNGLTLAVAAPELVACDLEPICHRSDQVWRDLLGPERWALAELISRQTGEDLQTSATRVWTALESLKKAGSLLDGQLVLVPGPLEKQGCVSLAAAGLGISSTIVTFRDDPIPVAVSILTQGAGNA
jgi:enediyne polyketide synthase